MSNTTAGKQKIQSIKISMCANEQEKTHTIELTGFIRNV